MNNQKIVAKLKKMREELDILLTELDKDSEPVEDQKLGVFDGEFMVTADGHRFQVPPNYASKSRIVVGDKLRLLEEGPQNMFKITEQVPRYETKGILFMRDEQWTVRTPQGDFKVLAASVKYYKFDIGDEVVIWIPQNYQECGAEWAAVVVEEEGGDTTENDSFDADFQVEELPAEKNAEAPSFQESNRPETNQEIAPVDQTHDLAEQSLVKTDISEEKDWDDMEIR